MLNLLMHSIVSHSISNISILHSKYEHHQYTELQTLAIIGQFCGFLLTSSFIIQASNSFLPPFFLPEVHLL